MYRYEFPRAMVTIDVVLFTVEEADVSTQGGAVVPGKRVKVIVCPRSIEPSKGALALPGTILRTNEDVDLDAAAQRALRDKCGLDGVFLEQLKTYGDRVRDPRDWSATTAYYALVPPERLKDAAPNLKKLDAVGIRGLPFDHDRIVADGIERIRGKANYTTLPTVLLPDSFTLTELEGAYEALMGRFVYTNSFRRKMESLTVEVDGRTVPYLIETGEKQARKPGGGRQGRQGALYRRATEDLVVFPQLF